MSRELLQQALDALRLEGLIKKTQAIAALEAELAKPEQELKAMHTACIEASMRNAKPEQAEKQEPVAWMYKGNFHDFDPSEWASPEFVVTPLSTAPPQREWVGLHLDDIPDVFVGDISFMEGAKWALAKLKEKNT